VALAGASVEALAGASVEALAAAWLVVSVSNWQAARKLGLAPYNNTLSWQRPTKSATVESTGRNRTEW